MIKRVIVISATESFIVRGLEMKLKGIGMRTIHSPATIFDIKKNSDMAELFVFYMDESIYELSDVLTYLKDLCLAQFKKVVLIGTKAEYDSAMKLLPEEIVWEWFERPLKMEQFLEKISGFMPTASIESKKKGILIVDDDTTYMHMIRDWLKEKYRVSMANSGIQAITWLAKNQADLILLDYEMPVTSGPQVLEMLKSEPSTSTIPVIFLTGKSDRESIMKVLDLKPAGYLLKTIEREELILKLENHFAGGGR